MLTIQFPTPSYRGKTPFIIWQDKGLKTAKVVCQVATLTRAVAICKGEEPIPVPKEKTVKSKQTAKKMSIIEKLNALIQN